MAKVSVIVVAAGRSERFEGKTKKPFANLDGRPMFIRTLERFINREDVCQTLLVIPPEDEEEIRRKFGPNLGFMGVSVVAGGEQRFDSVAAALAKVSEDAGLVAIHDAVRPCVTEEKIDAVFAEAAKTGAAILGVAVVSTLKRVSDAKVIDGTVDRENLYEAQTPQVFKREVILSAYEKLKGLDKPVTDDATLVEMSGHPVHVVDSDFSNIKITRKGDMALATAILKAQPGKKVQKFGAFEEAQW